MTIIEVRGVLDRLSLNYSFSSENIIKEDYIYTFNKNFLNGVDWIYTSLENNSILSIKVWYLNNYSLYNDMDFDFFFYQTWIASMTFDNYQLFNAILLDMYLMLSLNVSYFNSNWFNNFIFSSENSLIYFYHPELLWYSKNIDLHYYSNFGGKYNFVYFNKTLTENYILACTSAITIFFFFFLFTIFVVTFFNYYGNSNKEDSTIDSDYLLVSTTVEAEKEITSIDDFLGILALVSYIFGIFFYSYAWATFSTASYMAVIYLAISIMLCFVLGMPTMILYDLGIYFLVYLRGVGKGVSNTVEVMFDYITCTIFYARILAQWIRLVLMLITFLSLSHALAEFELNNSAIISNENPFTDKNSFIHYSTSYALFVTLPGKIVYILYELGHTLFVISSQFISFFAIVFWLFLFLYTFFISEKHEDFFSFKRKQRKQKLVKLTNLKLN